MVMRVNAHVLDIEKLPGFAISMEGTPGNHEKQ